MGGEREWAIALACYGIWYEAVRDFVGRVRGIGILSVHFSNAKPNALWPRKDADDREKRLRTKDRSTYRLEHSTRTPWSSQSDTVALGSVSPSIPDQPRINPSEPILLLRCPLRRSLQSWRRTLIPTARVALAGNQSSSSCGRTATSGSAARLSNHVTGRPTPARTP